MIQQTDFDSIVAAFQRAALDDERWPEVANQVDECLGVFCSQIAVLVDGDFTEAPDSGFGRVYTRGEVWEDVERDYLENYAALDERLPRVLALPYGRPVTNRGLLSEREIRTAPAICELNVRCGTAEQIFTKVDGGPGLDITWVLSKSTAQGEWEGEQVRLVERLGSHLCHAVAVRQELAAARLLGATVEEMLGGCSTGVVHLDRAGSIVGANPAAESILRMRDGLVDRCGELRAVHPDDDAKLGRLLGGALRKHASGVPRGGSAAIRRRNGERPLAVHVHPVGGFHATLGHRRPAALVLVGDAWEKPRIDPLVTGEILGLTPAEGRVVAFLAEGMSIRDIVAATGRTENTIRWQTKQAMSKTGCSRQADLVRLALAAVKPASSAVPSQKENG